MRSSWARPAGQQGAWLPGRMSAAEAATVRPARPASSPVLRGRRVSPDTLMLRQPETAGPAGPLALQKRDTFRTAPVFPVFLLGLFLAFRETVYGEHWTSIVPCCSFSEWGGADPRSRAGRDCGVRAPRAGLARRVRHAQHTLTFRRDRKWLRRLPRAGVAQSVSLRATPVLLSCGLGGEGTGQAWPSVLPGGGQLRAHGWTRMSPAHPQCGG